MSREAKDINDGLARLLSYTRPEFRADLEHCRMCLAEEHADAVGLLDAFEAATADLSCTQMEELFTRTFDLNPQTNQEIGWHLFGESYDRGAFLVWMRQQLRYFGLVESGELPDHLTHVLQVLGRMERPEADAFATEAVLPAVQRMLPGVKGKDNPFEQVLRAVELVLTARHGPARPPRVRLPQFEPQHAMGGVAQEV